MCVILSVYAFVIFGYITAAMASFLLEKIMNSSREIEELCSKVQFFSVN
jgi:voltage-gated potassium channel